MARRTTLARSKVGETAYLFLVVGLWTTVTWAEEPAPSQADANVSRWAQGKIAYRVKSTGHINGYEQWRLDVHPDGTKTMAATVRYSPRSVLRHVIHRVDAKDQPLDTFLSYWIDGAWRGNAWFVRDGGAWRGEILTPNGRLTHIVNPAGRFTMVPHVLAVDSWRARLFDKSEAGIQGILAYNVDATALSTASVRGKMMRYQLEYLGTERVTVPAGEFDTEHYRIEGVVDLYLFGPDSLVAKFVYADIDREHVLIDYSASEPLQ